MSPTYPVPSLPPFLAGQFSVLLDFSSIYTWPVPGCLRPADPKPRPAQAVACPPPKDTTTSFLGLLWMEQVCLAEAGAGTEDVLTLGIH